MHNLSLTQIIENIKSKKTTPKEVFDFFLDRINKYDPEIKSFNFINTSWLQEDINSPLAWIPISIKDNYAEIWIPTTWASNILRDFKPPYDATVIKKLKDAWMSSIWKVNMDEFAMWSTTTTSAIQITKNPWWENRIPGGSSWWSAASVSAWLVPASLWSDTWWSIRQPASMCNIVWFKPSYWRNSRYWIIPMWSSLDCPWTLTKTVRDAWLLYEIMNWFDEKEDTSIDGKDIIDQKIWERQDLKWLKIWLPKEYFEEWIDDWVKKTILEAVEKLKELWAEVKEISLPMTKYAIATYYILMPAEVSTNLARIDWLRYWNASNKPYSTMDEFYINNRTDGFWEEAQKRIILWSYVLSAWFYDAYYKKASQVRTLIIKDFKKAFSEVDVIVWPVSPNVAWEIDEKIDDPLKLYLWDAYTVPASLAWLPAISVPAWFSISNDSKKELLPVWLQIIAPHMQDQKVLEVANVFEKHTNYYKKQPNKFL